MSLKLTFRDGCANDGEQLLSVHTRAILHVSQNHYTHEELASWAYGLRAERYGERLKHEHYDVACLSDGKIIGFCGTEEDEITGLCVDPAFGWQGIGSALMMRAITRLRVGYDKQLRLTASLNALDFYRHHHWQEVRRFMYKSRGGLHMVAIDMILHLH